MFNVPKGLDQQAIVVEAVDRNTVRDDLAVVALSVVVHDRRVLLDKLP